MPVSTGLSVMHLRPLHVMVTRKDVLPPENEFSTVAPSLEATLFWRHLSLAGIYPGNFSGTGTEYVLGENLPRSSWHTGGYAVGNFLFQQNVVPQNAIIFGDIALPPRAGPSREYTLWFPVLVPKDARTIDLKIDDGVVQEAVLLKASAAEGDSCRATGSGGIKQYKLDVKDKLSCRMAFEL